jgi:hypothetical protein
MWDHCWNDRQIKWVGQRDHRWGWAWCLVRLLEWLRASCLWPWSGGWSGSRDAAIMLGRKGCQGTTIAGNNRLIINVIVIVCQDSEGVVVSCQMLVHNR